MTTTTYRSYTVEYEGKQEVIVANIVGHLENGWCAYQSPLDGVFLIHYTNGTRGRVDGPALYQLKTKRWWWYKDDRYHRNDGPYTTYNSGQEEYSLYGTFLSPEDYWKHPFVVAQKLRLILNDPTLA